VIRSLNPGEPKLVVVVLAVLVAVTVAVPGFNKPKTFAPSVRTVLIESPSSSEVPSSN